MNCGRSVLWMHQLKLFTRYVYTLIVRTKADFICNMYLNRCIPVLFIHMQSLSLQRATTCVYCLVLFVCFLVCSLARILNVISSSCVQASLGLYTNIKCFDYGNISFTEVAHLTHQSLQDQASFLWLRGNITEESLGRWFPVWKF